MTLASLRRLIMTIHPRKATRFPRCAAVLFAICMVLPGQTAPDLTRQSTLYAVGYAHLDTQWNWEYTTTINQYLPDTMHKNFALFEKYPHYIFNFTGANRYRLIKEYYPQD